MLKNLRHFSNTCLKKQANHSVEIIQVPRTYDKIIAIANKTKVIDQEEKNKIFTIY